MMGDRPFVQAAPTDLPISEQKKARILEVLGENQGNVNRTSVALGISAASLTRMLASWSQTPAKTTSPTSNSTTRRFYESLKAPWSVKSFDPATREACIEIRAKGGVVNLSFTTPALRTTY